MSLEPSKEDRRSPLTSQLVLLLGFALVLVASVFTVLLPELRSDEGEDEATEPAEESSEEPAGEPPAPAPAP